MLTIFGSINLDLVLSAPRAPEGGETLPARAPLRVPGGKGAIQALAAARAGAEVRMVGAVGQDGEAELALANLASALDISGVKRTETPTSLAVIVVEDGGENRILVCDGANMTLTADDAPPLAAGEILLLQNEIRAEARTAALAKAKASGAQTILSPSPVAGIALADISTAHTLIVNASEATALTGETGLDRAIAEICAAGPNVLVTLGPDGALWTDGTETHTVPGHHVEVVDTTGAGDTFAGSFAARRALGEAIPQALAYANAAAALACTAMGAQSAIPPETDVRRVLDA